MAGPAAADGAPTAEGKKLIRRDFQDAIGDLGAQRMISRQLLERSIGAFDPEVITVPRMYQMRKDPMIQMGLHFRKFPLIRREWHMECEDPQIGAGVEHIVRQQYGPYTRMMLNKFDFGFQAGVKQFELGTIDGTYEDPKTGEAKPIWESKAVSPVVLAPPIPLMPEFVTVKIKDGKFDGINTSLILRDNDEEAPIPPEWAVWTVNEFEENFRNYYGYPLTGYAYRYWWSSWFRHHMEDRHFEMDADPPLMVSYPIGTYTDTETGEKVSNQVAALRMGDDLRGGATIAKPSDVFVDDQGKAVASSLWDAEFLRGGENLQAFRQSAEYLDVMKLRAMLVPEQALVEGKGGTSSRNAAATYSDIFNESLAQEAEESDDDWNRHHIPQIKEANWGADAPTCRKVTTGFEEEDLELAKSLIETAFTLDPNALPINFEELLKQVRLPVYSVQEQEERTKQREEEEQENAEKAQALQQQQTEQAAEEGDPEAQAALSLGRSQISLAMPKWAKKEFGKRAADTKAVTARLESAVKKRYQAGLAAASAFVLSAEQSDFKPTEEDSDPVLRWPILMLAMARAYRGRAGTYDNQVQQELAELYHDSGAAELERLGLSTDSWDVDREDVQAWAEHEAGRLITTMDQTMVERHLRPWLSSRLSVIEAEGMPGQDVAPVDTGKLAGEMAEKFKGYPEWMAARVARTESTTGYNFSALDMYERIGVDEVQAYDGQGGFSGKTDKECLDRNGEIMTLAEAREAAAKEHPNGTFGVMPVVDPAKLRELGLDIRPPVTGGQEDGVRQLLSQMPPEPKD